MLTAAIVVSTATLLLLTPCIDVMLRWRSAMWHRERLLKHCGALHKEKSAGRVLSSACLPTDLLRCLCAQQQSTAMTLDGGLTHPKAQVQVGCVSYWFKPVIGVATSQVSLERRPDGD